MEVRKLICKKSIYDSDGCLRFRKGNTYYTSTEVVPDGLAYIILDEMHIKTRIHPKMIKKHFDQKEYISLFAVPYTDKEKSLYL